MREIYKRCFDMRNIKGIQINGGEVISNSKKDALLFGSRRSKWEMCSFHMRLLWEIGLKSLKEYVFGYSDHTLFFPIENEKYNFQFQKIESWKRTRMEIKIFGIIIDNIIGGRQKALTEWKFGLCPSITTLFNQ